MTGMPQTPRALAVQVAELTTKLNAALAEIQTRETAYHAAVAENTLLRQELDHSHQEVDQLMAQYESLRRSYQLAVNDMSRMAWWFENGDNTDEQLLELKRQKALDPKSVTLDMWRNAIDAAMENKRVR